MGVCARASRAAVIAFVALIAGGGRAAVPTPVPAAPAAAAKAESAKGAVARPLRPASHLKEGTLVVFNRPIITFRTSFMGSRDARARAVVVMA